MPIIRAPRVAVMALLLASALATTPAAPVQWQVHQKSKITGRQIESIEGTFYNDENLRATRSDRPGYAPVISLYHAKAPKGPERGVQAAVYLNHTCAQWCTIGGTYSNMIKVGDGNNATSMGKDMGPATVNNQSTEEWTWNDMLGPIAADSHTLYISSADNATPVQLILKEPLARFNEQTDFSDFSTDPLDPSTFQVDGLESCPMAPGCNPDGIRRKSFRALRPAALEIKLSS